QIFIREEDHDFRVERVDDRGGVGGRAAQVGFGFDVGISVDVAHYGDAGKSLLERADMPRGDACRERAAGFLGGQKDGFVRIEDFCGLGHKSHAAKDDDVLVGYRCPAAELERVADEVRNCVE